MKNLALILLLVLPIDAFSATWTLIYASDEQELEIDSASVRDKKAAWFKLTNTPSQKLGCGFGKEIESEKFYIEARCKEFTIRTKQTISYAPDGNVVPECGYENAKAAFTEYAPETMGELYFDAICYARARAPNINAQKIRVKKSSVRLEKILDDFVKNEPCPSTGEMSATCKGYTIQYIAPLCAYGDKADAVSNYKWVAENEVKDYLLQQKETWGCN